VMSRDAARAVTMPPAQDRSPRQVEVGLVGRTRGLKRVLDVVGSLVALVVLSPVLVGVAVAVRLETTGPALFRHRRVGRDGRTFTCLKFRTMEVGAEARLRTLLRDPDRAAEFRENHKLRDDPRVTRLGGFLRASSLDEIPQFLNVLRGDMSLVGPRPVVAEELARYGSAASLYCLVRPGMTGPWQVAGRSDTTFEERVALDVDYVRNGSVRQDLALLLQTAAVVVGRLGAY
jgi:lipopolysaccharide/colanic/teichoic acid biosynthesis glycosyltransferase